MDKTNTMRTALVASLLAALVGMGCGEAVDINRVQPNYVKKDMFNGEWYARSTVVDKQFANDATFIGYEGGTERVRWEVTEQALLALRSYERIPGTDQANPGEQNVLAIFPIVKHFDIKRDYNPVNGVETNVIIENDFDRPWQDRDYMRVNWSVNMASGYDPFFFGTNWVAAFGIDPGRGASGFDRNDDGNPVYPWRTRIEDDYLETTIDGMATPDRGVCAVLDPLSPCNATRAKIKMSFRKADPNNDYVPLDYPDFKTVKEGVLVRADNGEPIYTSTMTVADDGIPRRCLADEVNQEGLGQFRVLQIEGLGTRICNPASEVLGGDPEEACETITARCENMEPLFISSGPEDVSLACDPNVVSPDSCFELSTPMFSRFGFFRTDRFAIDRENGATLTARERLIDRFNVWEKSRNDDGTIIPMAERTPKPIIYYTNVQFPQNLAAANKQIEADWDVAFRNMVASVKGISPNDVPQMFYIKENDCNIKAVNKFAKDNDLEEYLSENGIEKVEIGNLETACAVLEFASKAARVTKPNFPTFAWQQLGDLRYSILNWTPKAELAGPLGYGPHAADPLTGEVISGNANIYGTSLDTYANFGADVVQLINGEISIGDIMNGTHVREHVEAVRNRWQTRLPQTQVDSFKQLFDARTARFDDDNYLLKTPVTALNVNHDKLAESGFEAEHLVDTEMALLFGKGGLEAVNGNITPAMIDAARPSSWARHALPAEAVRTIAGAQAGGVDLEDTRAAAPDMSGPSHQAYQALAEMMGRHSMCFLAQQVEPAVAGLAAEIADLGLSREEMVKLIRERVYIAVTAHELGHTFGLRHNFEASADPINFFPQYWGIEDLGEAKNHMLAKTPRRDEMMYSSIMDYTQRFNSDFAGIGLYDKAAIKFGYGETVEVFDETDGFFVSRDWIGNLSLLDPAEIPQVLGGIDANARINDEYDVTVAELQDGDANAVMDILGESGITPRPENIFKRRDISMRDFFRNEALRLYTGALRDDTANNREILRVNGLLDDDGTAPKIAVPYTFCSDAFAWGGNLTCNLWDKGVTSREIVENAGELYEFYYPFNAFRGDRAVASDSGFINGYLNRLYSRTYQPMLNAFRYFYYYRRSSARIFPAINDWAEASLRGMNFFANVLQTPDTGRYCNDNGVWEPEAQADSCDNSVVLDTSVGRKYNTTWDTQYIYDIRNVGYAWDKIIAVQALTDSNALFFRDFSSEVNRGAFSIGYYRVFPREMLRLFGGLITGDSSVITARLTFDTEGNPQLQNTPFLTTDIYGNPVDSPVVDGDPIVPATSYRLRLFSATMGMVNLTSVYDQAMDFAQRAKVSIAGSPSDPTYDPSIINPATQIATFTHPETHIEYRAARMSAEDEAIGFRLLNDAQALIEGDYADAKAALEAAEAGNDAEGVRDARVAFDAERIRLDEQMEVIEWMIFLGNIFEFPL